ncbi:MAG: hypothetical protein OER88_13730, partial [Planctomycetota bacterium]|nr:hypothetical protein [Planctomycetota bacterium]
MAHYVLPDGRAKCGHPDSVTLGTGGRMRAGPLVIVLLLTSAAFAQDKPKPLTPERAADEVLAAFKATDQAALKALAKRDNPDPWLVADELCARGEHDTAEAFAKAAPRKATEKLPAY